MLRLDKEDYTRVHQSRWSSQGRYFRIVRKWENKQHNIYLHHFLIGMPLNRSLEVDHINRNPEDNRKSNLRFVTRRANMRNRKPGVGVYWHKDRTKWVAQAHDMKPIYLGSFETRRQARAVYNKWYKEARYVHELRQN
jgi:hypothetical protein